MYLVAGRRHDGKAGRWAKLAGLWSIIGGAFAAFAVAVYMAATHPPDAYQECQRSAIGASATSMMIVDPTDRFTQIHRARIKTTIETERDRMPLGGRLVILMLNAGSPFEPVELASVCNPGRVGNPLWITQSRMEARWRENYGEPIAAAIERAVNGPTSAASPIILTIAAALARPDFDARARERRLTLISDLVEHQKGGYSQLKGEEFWSGYRASSLAHSVRLDLRGVAVSLDYLPRGEYAAIQGLKHQEFWQRLFTEAGAGEVRFVGQQGPAEVPGADGGKQLAKETRSK